MVSIYVSHKFVEEFQSRNDIQSEVIHDFRNLLIKKIRGVDVISELEIHQLNSLIQSNEFYNDLSEISPIISNKMWLSNIDNEEFLKSGNPSKLFLLPNEINCDELIVKHNILFINNSNLSTVWKQVGINRDISEMTPSYDSESSFSFTDWKQLSKFKHPFRNLLILDLYLLGDKKNQRYTENIIPLVKSLSSFISNSKFELTIVSEAIWGARNGNPMEKINEVYKKLNFADCKLVYYDEKVAATNGSLKEHDREIISNYLVFECPAGWNIFKEKRGVNHRTKIYIKSIFKNDVRNTASKAIQNFKKYYNSIKDRPIQVPISGQFDESGKLKMKDVFYHYPVEIKPSF